MIKKNFSRKILTRLLVVFSGSSQLTNFILWPLAKRVLGEYQEVVDIGDGIKMTLFNHMGDMVNKTLLFYAPRRKYAWEPITTRLFDKLVVNKKSVCVAGAHLGYYCLIAASHNPSATIFAFEPVLEIYGKFLANIKLNKLNNITATNAALSDKTGISYIENNNAQSSLNTKLDSVGKKINTYTLDDFFKDKENKPDLILLDVEGYELFVLNGARETLQRGPDIIFEVNKKMLARNNTDVTIIIDFLHNYGYNFFFIEDEYELPDLSNDLSQINLRRIDAHSLKEINMSFYNVFATKTRENDLIGLEQGENPVVCIIKND